MNAKQVFWLSTLWIFLLGLHLELSDQEAYYWTWSTQPALCYFEHPPLQAWITHLFTSFLGDAAWVVRLPATLGRIASFSIFGVWVSKRFGEEAAEIARWILLTSFFFVAGSLISLPDSVMLPFALLTILLAERRCGWSSGFALGVAGLAKWTSVLLVPGVVMSFLGRGPRDFKGLAKNFLVAGLLQIPVLVWNRDHHWASFLFHLQKRREWIHGTSLPEYLRNFFAFAGSQVLIGGIGLVVALFYARRYLLSDEKIRPLDSEISLGWWIWPAFIVFGYSSIRGEARFYWTCAAFPPLAAWLASHLAVMPPEKRRALKGAENICLWGTLVLATAALLLPVGAYLKPFTDLYKPYDLRHSPRGDLKGWVEWVNEDIRPAGLLGDDTAFMGSDFHVASQVAWAARLHDMGRVGTTAPAQFQFEFWPPRPAPPRYTRAVFFADNRHRTTHYFDAFCEDRLPDQWRTKEIFLRGALVKKIFWTVCEKFRAHAP